MSYRNAGQARIATATLVALHRKLIHLRNTHPALAHGDLSLVDAENLSITAYLRQTDDEIALMILNFGTSPVKNPALTAYASQLDAGSYRLTPLLSGEPATDLDIEPGVRSMATRRSRVRATDEVCLYVRVGRMEVMKHGTLRISRVTA